MLRNLVTALLILILTACRPAPGAAPTQPGPDPAAAASPTSPLLTQVTSTLDISTPAHTATPLPQGMEIFIFPHYESLAVIYASDHWQPDKGMGQGLLANRDIPGCEISDSSDQAPPEPQYSSPVDGLEYRTTRQRSTAGLPVNWFFPPPDLAVAVPEDAGPVYLVVYSTVNTEHECLEAAKDVLATLTSSGLP